MRSPSDEGDSAGAHVYPSHSDFWRRLASVLALGKPRGCRRGGSWIFIGSCLFRSRSLWGGVFTQLKPIGGRKIAKAGARESETFLRSLVDGIPGLIATADSNGEHLYASYRLLNHFGISRSDVSGRGWLNIVHPDDRDGVATAWSHSIRTGTPMDITHRRRRFDGEYRWFHERVEPAFDGHGDIERWYGLITDIDDEKRAEQALEAKRRELEQLIDAVPALVWSARARWFCRVPESAMARIHRNGRGAGRRLGLDGCCPSGGSRVACRLLRALLSAGAPGETEARLRRADGRYRWFLFRGEPYVTNLARSRDGLAATRISMTARESSRRSAKRSEIFG